MPNLGGTLELTTCNFQMQFSNFVFFSLQQLKDEIADVTAEMETMDISEEK